MPKHRDKIEEYRVEANTPLALALKDNFEAQKQLLEIALQVRKDGIAVGREEKALTIEDLYVSDDFSKGLEMGKRLFLKATQDNPIVIDEHTWFYIERDKLVIIHEIYNHGKYLLTDTVHLPKILLSALSPNEE